MKKAIVAAAVGMLMSGTAHAEKIGISFSSLEHPFLIVMAKGMTDHAAKIPGLKLQLEDAQDDIAKQLDQLNNFIASGVDAIIVQPVETSATQALTDAAAKAKVPLVFVNREPINVDALPDGQAFVASNEVDSGTLETREVCRLLKQKGKGTAASILVMVGQLSQQGAIQRAKDVHDVIATPECSFMKVVEEQTANWNRAQAQDLMTNWISKGVKFDAIIAANDEMAIGANQALKAASVPRGSYILAGIDAEQEALAAMKAGDLDATVFQDANGQGVSSIDTALALAKGKKVEKKVYIPFQLVTPANMAGFLDKN